MNKNIIFGIVALSLLLISCSEFDVSQISDEDMQRISQHAVVCNPPYIRHGTGCCLDINENGICDEDEMPEREVTDDDSFETGKSVRDTNTTALDVITITSHNDISNEKIYGLTILVRARAGSYAYSLAGLGMVVTNRAGSFTAMLQHTENEDLDFSIASVNNVTATTIVDVDEDRVPDNVILVSTTENERLRFFFTRAGEIAYADLNLNFSNAAPSNPIDITIQDVPIIGESGRWYGFVQIDGTAESHTSIGLTADIRITRYPVKDFCSFDTLIPETAFCYDAQLGLEDTEISRGEIYRLYYRFRPQNAMRPDEAFQIQFIPEKGDVTSIVGATPDSLRRESGEIWPTTLET